MNKYDITSETRLFGPVTLHRITALRDIPRHGVKAGDLGGWIESERIGPVGSEDAAKAVTA